MKKQFSLILIIFCGVILNVLNAQQRIPFESAIEVLRSKSFIPSEHKTEAVEILRDTRVAMFELSVHCELQDTSYFVLKGIHSNCCNRNEVENGLNSAITGVTMEGDTAHVYHLPGGDKRVSYAFTRARLQKYLTACLANVDIFSNSKVTTINQLADILSKATIDDLANDRHCSYVFSSKGMERVEDSQLSKI